MCKAFASDKLESFRKCAALSTLDGILVCGDFLLLLDRDFFESDGRYEKQYVYVLLFSYNRSRAAGLCFESSHSALTTDRPQGRSLKS